MRQGKSLARLARRGFIGFAFAGAPAGFSGAAHAALLQVDLTGNFTMFQGPDPNVLPTYVPFSGSFDVDTSIAPVQHLNLNGLSISGYTDAAISNISITAFGYDFSASEILDRNLTIGGPEAAVYFPQDLTAGSTTLLYSFLHLVFDPTAPVFGFDIVLGGLDCGTNCSFNNQLTFYDDADANPVQGAQGTVTASVIGASVPVPEPASLAVFGVGLAALVFVSKSFNKRLPFRGLSAE